MPKFIVLFLTLVAALFFLEMLQPVQQHLVQPFTHGLAMLSAMIVMPFDQEVMAQGRVIRHSVNGFAVSIEAGCNGVEAAIVLIAGILAFPAMWRHRALAIVIGFGAIQALNLVRIISLFYLGQWSEAAFGFTHLYLWPVLIMLDVLIVFLIYLRFLQRRLPSGAET